MRAGVQMGLAVAGNVKPDGQHEPPPREKERLMNNIIYIVGLVVIVIAVMSFFGLR